MALVLVLLPSCFLPGWQERPWVDDDAADDDTADDDASDDDTVVADIELSGEAELYIRYQTTGENCVAPITGEVNEERTKIDGDGECTLLGYVANLELDCDLAGSAVDGTLLLYNDFLPFPLTIPVDGTYDDDAVTASIAGSTSFYGIIGEVTIELQAAD